jgi:plastocyanin
MRNGVIVAILGVVCLSAMSALHAVVMPHERSGAHVVRMIGDSAGYRFEPASIVISVGDSVVFEVVSGQPHSVAFDTAAVPRPAAHVLSKHMGETLGFLSGPLLLGRTERYVISFADLPPGRYPFYCLPHLASHMRGEVIVR